MLVRDAIQARLSEPEPAEAAAGKVSLPRSLKLDGVRVRTAMFQRLAASRLFAYGDRSGVLRSAQARSGRAFRLEVRQRVVVKALVSRHAGTGAARGAALAAHVAYLGRSGAGAEGAKAAFFDRSTDAVDATAATHLWAEDRHHFRFIISPEHGDRIADLRRYTREVMRRVAEDLGQPDLDWIGACHFDTDQPHAHVLIRGKRAGGRDLVIPRDYVGYGFRARAQEVAHELLGDLSRADSERRIWRETEADRLTGFDRRLLQAADAERLVDDGVGVNDAWSALTRGRLRHLERIGLATRVGRRYRLDKELEPRLRGMQLQKDIIRTLHQRRLDGGREVRELEAQKVRGRVVRSGFHDELGGMSYVILRDREGVEHYARLRFGERAPEVGRAIELMRTERGAYALQSGRGLSERGIS
jgi:type IV secretory pathway VirD2 relaxase